MARYYPPSDKRSVDRSVARCRGKMAQVNVRTRNNVTFAGAESGTTVMLAHGFGCDQNLWRLVAARLRDRFRLVLFDHVGSGKSDAAAWDAKRYSSLQGYADDILDIVSELDLTDVVFVGHSVAAMMGVLAVAKDASRFAKLVLLTPSPSYLDHDGYIGGFSRDDIDELLESMESNYLGWSRAMAPNIMGTPDRPELQEELTETFCRNDPAKAQVFARTTFLSDNRADLSRVEVPALVIECLHDTLAPRSVGAYTHEHIAGSEIVTIDATGHCPQLSAPDETAAAIAAFAASA
jgi:sigma-B regulation protein RsbQ